MCQHIMQLCGLLIAGTCSDIGYINIHMTFSSPYKRALFVQYGTRASSQAFRFLEGCSCEKHSTKTGPTGVEWDQYQYQEF